LSSVVFTTKINSGETKIVILTAVPETPYTEAELERVGAKLTPHDHLWGQLTGCYPLTLLLELRTREEAWEVAGRRQETIDLAISVLPSQMRKAVEFMFGIADGRYHTLEEVAREFALSTAEATMAIDTALFHMRGKIAG
jgi:hypothetical protein